MKNKNCPNCAAPYDPNLIRCPYCGTIYFDFPALDADNRTPVWLRFKHDNKLILHKAYLSSANFEVSQDHTAYSYYADGELLTTMARTEVTTTLEFVGSDDTLVIEVESEETIKNGF